jgi:hypothetical protein
MANDKAQMPNKAQNPSGKKLTQFFKIPALKNSPLKIRRARRALTALSARQGELWKLWK